MQVGRNGSCLVCSALSKAPTAVEGVTDPKKTSSKVRNGQGSSRKVSSATESASRSSRSSHAPENGGTSAVDAADTGRQPRGKAGTWPSPRENDVAEQSKPETTSATAGEPSTQHSSASLRQSVAVDHSEDSSSEERRRSASSASTSTAPVEDELPSEHLVRCHLSALSDYPDIPSMSSTPCVTGNLGSSRLGASGCRKDSETDPRAWGLCEES